MRNWFIVLILLTISACTAEGTASPTRISSGVTSIPNSIDFLPTDEPQATSIPPTVEVTQEVISCPSAPPVRLIIQERGRVTDNNETLNLREGPGISFDVLTALEPRDEFVVIDGPSCDGEFAWFRVRFETRFGWLAEGDFEDYYVEPYLTG
ncbi:MAG: hypothetical protein Phog2KO_12820 [Phototrophicaceae bacterium]